MDYLLHHLFLNAVQKHADKTAIVDGEATFTYSQISKLAGGLREQLLKYGVEKGDRIAFYLEHGAYQAVSILAILASDAVFVPVNKLLFPEQVKFILNDAEAKVLITTREKYAGISSLLSGECETQVMLIDELKGEVAIDRHGHCIENDLAALLYTSGSTGFPKGVMLSHRNLIAGTWIVSEYLNLTHQDRLLGLLPLSFDYGLNQLLTMFALGGTYIFLNFQFPNQIVEALDKYKITGLAGIPPIWTLLGRSSLAKRDLPCLRYITNSGGSIPTKVVEFLREALPGTDIVLMYGLTEAFRSTYLPPEEFNERRTSIGKAIPNTEILVLSESGSFCASGQVGELVHRGPTVGMGYWKRPEETAMRYRYWPLGKQEGGYERVVFSGDLVRKDDQGFLYFVGRNDGMIKCSGNRISPFEIEEVVLRSGQVRESAAIGIPDEALGQVVKVYVVPSVKPDNQSEYGQCIIDYCSMHMPGYMVPRIIELIDQLPKTPNGKVDYPKLRDMHKG